MLGNWHDFDRAERDLWTPQAERLRPIILGGGVVRDRPASLVAALAGEGRSFVHEHQFTTLVT